MKNTILCVCMMLTSMGVAPAIADKLETKQPTATLTPRQRAWNAAGDQGRIKIAERIGEDGARAFAESKGYKPILTSADKAIPQGFDQVYRAPTGDVVVIEAKGGTSAVTRAYGYEQGTAEWAIRAAKRTAQSSRATMAEKEAARVVLKAATDGRLTVQVIRTSHVYGEPTVAKLVSSAKATAQEGKVAAQLLEELHVAESAAKSTTTTTSQIAARASTQAPSSVAKVAKTSGKMAGKTTQVGTLANVSKAAVPIAVAADVGIRGYDVCQVEQKYRSGKISQKERIVSHSKNAAGMAGGWTGAYVGAEAGAATGGAIGAFFWGVGAPVGAVIGGIAGAIGGYFGGEYVAEKGADMVIDAAY